MKTYIKAMGVVLALTGVAFSYCYTSDPPNRLTVRQREWTRELSRERRATAFRSLGRASRPLTKTRSNLQLPVGAEPQM